jgi:thioredoxin 1
MVTIGLRMASAAIAYKVATYAPLLLGQQELEDSTMMFAEKFITCAFAYGFATWLLEDNKPFPQMEDQVVTLTADNFEKEVLESELPVVVDAYTTWCPPCRAFAPIFSNQSNAMTGKVKFAKVDVMKEPDLAKKLKIEAMPTLLFFNNREEVSKNIGALPANQFVAKINESFELQY